MPRFPEEHMRALQSVSRGQRWCVKGGVCEVVCERWCVGLFKSKRTISNESKQRRALGYVKEQMYLCERADVRMCPAKLPSYNSN